MMKAKLYLFFTLVWSIPASAQILGGEINYRCLGQNKYEAFVDLVASCSTTISMPTIYIKTDTTTFQADSVSIFGQYVEYNISENCVGSDTCNPYKSIKHRYRGIFDLSNYSGCTFRIYIEEPTTNIASTYTNRNSFCVYTEFNTCADSCGESPELKNYGPTTYAYNQDLWTSHGMNESYFPNDSFVYSLTPALESLSQPISYSGNFSSLRPLTFFGFPNQNLQWPAGIFFDKNNGTLGFRPTSQNQIATVAVQISIFREINSVKTLIGIKQIEKHYQFITSPTNKVPEISPPYSIQACVGVKSCLKVTVFDDDAGDTLKVTFSGNLSPNMEIVTKDTSKAYPEFEICFTPDTSQVRLVPYVVTAIVQDNACPLRGQRVRTYSFFAREPLYANPIIDLDSCGKLTFVLPSPNNVHWASSSVQVKDSITGTVRSLTFPADSAYLEAGTHYFQMNLRNSYGCQLNEDDTLRIQGPVYPKHKFPSQLFQGCIDDRIQFGQMNPETDVDYLWNDGLTNPSRHMTLGPDTTVLLLNSSRSYCVLNDTFRFMSDSIPNPGFTAGWQDSITLRGAINFPLSQVNYLWTIKDSLTFFGPTFSVANLPYGNIKVSVKATHGYCQTGLTLFVSQPWPNALKDKVSPKIYPNPFSRSIFIDGKEIQEVKLFNALGQEIAVRLNGEAGLTQVSSIAELPTGVYWLMIKTEAGYFVERVVKE